MQWIRVDETGRVPGVSATLPTGYEVLLDNEQRIADMRPVATPAPTEQTQAPASAPQEEG